LSVLTAHEVRYTVGSQKDVAGTRQRNSGISQRSEYGGLRLRMLATPRSFGHMAALETEERAHRLVGGGRAAEFAHCPYRKSDPDVLVVQSAEMRLYDDPADALNFARDRCVLVQRQIRPGLVVKWHIRGQQVPKVTLTKYHDMVR
jgi:hypothetical protein